MTYDAISLTHVTYIPSPLPPYESQLPPVTGPRPFTHTSPISSPTNTVDSDIDFLLSKNTLDFHNLTIHKPHKFPSPHIIPTLVDNITVCQNHNKDSRHFREHPQPLPFSSSDPHALFDVPIASSNLPWALRVNVPAPRMT